MAAEDLLMAAREGASDTEAAGPEMSGLPEEIGPMSAVRSKERFLPELLLGLLWALTEETPDC